MTDVKRSGSLLAAALAALVGCGEGAKQKEKPPADAAPAILSATEAAAHVGEKRSVKFKAEGVEYITSPKGDPDRQRVIFSDNNELGSFKAKFIVYIAGKDFKKFGTESTKDLAGRYSGKTIVAKGTIIKKKLAYKDGDGTERSVEVPCIEAIDDAQITVQDK